MAYFYQHIKGLTSSGTSWKIDCEQIDGPVGSMATPQLLFTKTGSSSVNMGNFITSDIENGRINNDFTFNKKVLNTKQVIFGNNSTSVFNNTENTTDNSGYYIRFDSTNNYLMMYAYNELRFRGYASTMTINNQQLKFEGNSTIIRFTTDRTIHNSSLIECPISFSINSGKGFAITTLTLENNTAGTAAWFNVPIKCDNSIHATYFNATSDKRAKTGINQSTFSALNIIKSLPIYNFKYKSDGSDSIGIIAQEALKVDAGNFSLVANSQASGENGDYMSVKESKLVYVAWKAIQEQQEIIDKQSKEIEELKQLVKTLIQK